jgi:hypothetical protein
MVPHRGVPVVAVHVSERHRRGSERGYDENSKNFLQNVFHGNPSGSKGVSDEKRDAKPEATAMRRYFNAVTGSESLDERWEHYLLRHIAVTDAHRWHLTRADAAGSGGWLATMHKRFWRGCAWNGLKRLRLTEQARARSL